MKVLAAVALGLAVVSIVLADLRWLRVAQREHYLAGAVLKFARRWWSRSWLNVASGTVAVAGAVSAAFVPALSIPTAVVVAVGPVGLRIRGRTSRLAWTRRMYVLCAFTMSLEGLLIALAASLGGGLSVSVVAASVVAICVPGLVDVSLVVLSPIEDLLAESYVRRATAVLAKQRPLVVGITGSYGKTTTKNYLAFLLGAERSVVASPRSFNNRAGLTRTVNEHLSAGTEVLVAEMGAYGPGEIAALCSWLQPEIAIITSIGPAHLERFGTLDRTLEAKAEITAGARVVVLNIDDNRLAGLAKRLDATHKVIRVSGVDGSAEVAVLEHVNDLELRVAGVAFEIRRSPEGSLAPIRTNAACAAAVAIEIGIAPQAVAARLGALPGVPNRLQPYRAEGGYLVLDDTFNSNPAGARHALETLNSKAPTGRRMLVTPGMVELGKSQYEENAALAEEAAGLVTDVVIVGKTNRAALLEGCRRPSSSASVKVVNRREEAVAWARAQLGPDDAVLFENDLPDHFP